MNIKKTVNGNRVTLAVAGIIDTTSSLEFEREIKELCFDNLDLTIDFTNTEYITSAGLRVLLVARKNLSDDSMRIIGVNQDIEEVFKTTGFDKMLNYSVSKKAAVDKSMYLSFKSLLKKAVEETPDKTAFVYKNREYTFSDIEKASLVIANDLKKMGVKKGSHVGICSQNSINWVFSFYAIQKLGAIAVLVNYGLKPNEIISLSEIGDIEFLCYGGIDGVTDYNTVKSAVLSAGCTIKHFYDISSNADFTERFDEYETVKDYFPETYHVDDASVIIFTSGSSGKPKAVLLSSYNLINGIMPLISEFNFNESDINCAFLPFFHIFGFSSSIVIGMIKGIVSCIPKNNKPDEILSLIENKKCTVFHSVPTMILAIASLPDFSPERVKSLRVSALGGAAITTPQMENLMKLFPNNHFANIYGMSENAAISVTAYGDTSEHITGTVGKPLSHVELDIRDTATGKSVADGEAGEIFIRSDTMIICYYKMGLDDQPLDMDGWLQTGDLGVVCPDGYLKLVGRAKDLIIRGGENISPREVADAVSSLKGIKDVKVVGVPDDYYGEKVAAAIITEKDYVFCEEEVKKVLSEKLAKFKIPEYFVVFESFPLLGSGKTDDKAIKNAIIERLKNE